MTTIFTTAKSNSAATNAQVTHAITGHIVGAASLKSNVHRVPICHGTPVTIVVSDTTGVPRNQAQSSGIVCNPTGCTVASLVQKEKYISRARQGSDVDRVTLLPQ